MEKKLTSNLWSIIRRFRWRILFAVLSVFIANALLILNPLIFRQALLFLVPQPNDKAPWPFLGPYSNSILAWGSLLLAIATLSALFKFQMRWIFLSLSRQIELELREKIFDCIQSQSKAFFDQHGIGDLLSRLTNDISAYRDLLGPGLMFPAFFLSLVFPAMAVLFYLSPLMAAISLIPIIAIYLLNLLLRRPLLKISQHVQESLADMSRMTHEHYSGIKLIKSYGIEKETAARFDRFCQYFSSLNMRFATLESLFFPLITMLTKIVTLGLVFAAAIIILFGWHGEQMNTADFLSFMWIQSYIFGPLLMLAWMLPMYQKGKAAYFRLVHIYEEPIQVQANQESLLHLPPHANIEFRDLTFSYPTHPKEVLSHFNLSIQGGSFVGITGPVGAGKTTLFRLLNREYEVPHGKIFLGGKDIHEYSLEVFQKEIVTVEQLPFLFSKSIKDNVRFGKQEATLQEIEIVAQQADLHETVLDFPSQYDTLVGERGVSLSGGQKQRVAIARAFLVNRSILLLDDIFSSVDSMTEKKIFQAIKDNFKERTILLVTHRVSILEQLDRVIYMVNGRIVEDGTPAELVDHHGPYKALVDLQRLNFK